MPATPAPNGAPTYEQIVENLLDRQSHEPCGEPLIDDTRFALAMLRQLVWADRIAGTTQPAVTVELLAAYRRAVASRLGSLPDIRRRLALAVARFPGLANVAAQYRVLDRALDELGSNAVWAFIERGPAPVLWDHPGYRGMQTMLIAAGDALEGLQPFISTDDRSGCAARRDGDAVECGMTISEIELGTGLSNATIHRAIDAAGIERKGTKGAKYTAAELRKAALCMKTPHSHEVFIKYLGSHS